jgi:hypothetical protein
MRCQVVFNNEHSLHLWKRHPCISTVERQLINWHEQVATWRDLRGPLYSHSGIVCLLIQSNCIELQPSINILIWVVWLFYHPVFMYITDYRNGCATSEDLFWKLDALQSFIRDLHWPDAEFRQHLEQRLKLMACDMIDSCIQRYLQFLACIMLRIFL